MYHDHDDHIKEMVRNQIIHRGIRNEKLLSAMIKVKRHLFVLPDLENQAYNDSPLGIGFDQTISQPYMVALMTDVLNISVGMSVLEIGTGSGYQTAILAELADVVFSVERIPELSERASRTLKTLGYDNIFTSIGDGSKGWEEFSPFDRIIVTAGGGKIPEPLIAQLKMNGILVIPVGDRSLQKLTKVVKVPALKSERNYELQITHHEHCIFVPLIGEYA